MLMTKCNYKWKNMEINNKSTIHDCILNNENLKKTINFCVFYLFYIYTEIHVLATNIASLQSKKFINSIFLQNQEKNFIRRDFNENLNFLILKI